MYVVSVASYQVEDSATSLLLVQSCPTDCGVLCVTRKPRE